MKKTKLQNLQVLDEIDSISIMSGLEPWDWDSGLWWSGFWGSGEIPYHKYPSGYQDFGFTAKEYALVEGIGPSATYTIRGNYIIKDLKLTIYAEVSKACRQDCDYYAMVSVKKDGQTFDEAVLAPLTGSNITDADWNPIGKTTVSVPPKGKVTIKLITSQNFKTDIGNSSTFPHTETLYDK